MLDSIKHFSIMLYILKLFDTAGGTYYKSDVNIQYYIILNICI